MEIACSFRGKTLLLHSVNSSNIQIHDKFFEVYLSQNKIEEAVKTLANTINNKYHGKEVIFVGVLNGAFMFSSDLLKNIDLVCEVSFVKMASYQGTQSTGRVDQLIGLVNSVEGKHVVILEDIVDTGLTLEKLRVLLTADEPASIAIASLLFKPNAFQGKLKPEFIGLEIPNDFVVGYGLDYNERGRNLREIYKLVD
jgi:hypoxanthine phosphoribosyltransferase